MKVLIKNRRGQFLVLTAFLVVVILSSAIIVSYKRIQENSFSNAIILSSSMTDVNNSLSELLGFTVGYYGSMIQVTGNVTYAQIKTVEYLESGLVTVAHSHVDWGTTFALENVTIHTNWYNSTSSTDGDITISYDIPSIGLMGAKFKTYASIKVQILETIGNQSRVKVTIDKDRVDLSLLRSNFRFFKYDQYTNRWNYIELPSDPVVTTSGEYLLTIPTGINNDAYYLQVVDRRGIMVTAGFVKGVGTLNKKDTSYMYTFNWPSAHNTLNDTPIVVELLQNGTLRWLGEDLPIVGGAHPIPPIPVKGIRVNATLKSDLTKSFEIPFQIEDWGSHYQVPYGITSNATIFNENCMIVFLVNYKVDHVTVWWDGRDVAKQREYGYKNYFFTGDNTAARHLSNGIINLDLRLGDGNDYVSSSTVFGTPVESRARFLRINSRDPMYGAPESYTIHHGVVRDIVQQEPEWSGGIGQCPDMYSHIVITLPAQANYYTYKLRTIFLETTLTRNINDLQILSLAVNSASPAAGTQYTESDIVGGLPVVSISTPITDGDPLDYDPHWSEFRDASNNCVGTFFTNTNNDQLFYFNTISPNTGAIEIVSKNIYLRPVRSTPPVNGLQSATDLTWYGAIAASGTGQGRDTVYYNPGANPTGLWILVEKLPTITVS